jgi:hypothetical protein
MRCTTDLLEVTYNLPGKQTNQIWNMSEPFNPYTKGIFKSARRNNLRSLPLATSLTAIFIRNFDSIITYSLYKIIHFDLSK